jgi:hypothetical protein
MYTDTAGIRLPAASKADRSIAKASKVHCTAQVVLGRNNGCRFQAESHLELRNLFVVNGLPNVAQIKEQALFEWCEGASQKRHYFDLVAVFSNGQKIAFTVKPEIRLLSGKFLAEMQHITHHALNAGFCDEVRLVTERDIDPVVERNGRQMAAVREVDPVADRIALKVVEDLVGAVSLKELTAMTGLKARGYRALLRLIRDHHLHPASHEIIKPQTLVSKMEVVQ